MQKTHSPIVLKGHQFEILLERGERVFVLRTQDLEETLAQFNRFAGHSGKAAYLWRPARGLKSLKVTGMEVPGSIRLQDALRYIADSTHYGVYAFAGFERELDLNCVQHLTKLSIARAGYDRKLLFISEQTRLPHMVTSLATKAIHESVRRLRLRDGRWVI